MKLFERSPKSVPPYRLPSRHPLADAGDRRTQQDDAGVDSREKRSRTASATGNHSDVKRRQQALLIAYLIRRAR
jgi:hypothetical protein